MSQVQVFLARAKGSALESFLIAIQETRDRLVAMCRRAEAGDLPSSKSLESALGVHCDALICASEFAASLKASSPEFKSQIRSLCDDLRHDFSRMRDEVRVGQRDPGDLVPDRSAKLQRLWQMVPWLRQDADTYMQEAGLRRAVTQEDVQGRQRSEAHAA